VLDLLLQNKALRGSSVTRTFRHLGAAGLFILAFLDSTPLPTFGGPDILLAILAGSHREPWYEYVAAATAGSVIGAYVTYRIGRGAGSAYLGSKFAHGRAAVFLKFFQRWGTGSLVASTAIPFPFPTSMIFAAAGASAYPLVRYVSVITVCRAVRYSAIAVIADLYGRHFIRVIRHPIQYWGWLLLFAAVVAALIAGGILINRKLDAATAA
jgi:membrane protein YqaA with SNARE-associated domain